MILILRLAEGMRCEGCGAVDRFCDVKLRMCLECRGRHLRLVLRRLRPEPPAMWRAAMTNLRQKIQEFNRGRTLSGGANRS